MSIVKFIKDPLFWLFMVLVVAAGFLIVNIDVNLIRAQTPIFGDGNNRYLAKWTGTFTPPPSDFTLSQGSPLACNSAPLSWTASADATTYKILRGTPRVDISPYQPYTALNYSDTTVSQNTSYTYQIEASNTSGSVRSNSISITTPYCQPVITFSASKSSIYQGQSTTLTWSTTNATSCTASGNWSGSKATNGSEIVSPTVPPSATYTLTCTGPGGTASTPVYITITELPGWKEVLPR